MAQFAYTAVTAEGQVVEGTLAAAHRRSALQSLEAKGLTPTDLMEVGAAGAQVSWLQRLFPGGRDGTARLKGAELTETTRQLATMVNSDVTLVDALGVIYDQAEQVSVRTTVGKLRDAVRSGESLSNAMAAQPRTFSPLYLSMVRVGETGGILGNALNQMADVLESEQEVRGEVRAALAYPIIVLCLGVAMVTIILTLLMPRILRIFSGMESALPTPTKMLIAIGAFMQSHWWHLALVVAAVVVMLAELRRTEKGQAMWDRLRVRLPLFGALVRKSAIARFSRCLGALVHGGVPLLEGLAAVNALLNNRVMSRLIDRATTSIKEGKSFADSLRGSELFPPMVTHMIAVGEKTGKLDQMLLRIAETYERQTRMLIRILISLLPPFLIISLAMVVGFIALSLLLPIFMMSQMVAR